MGLAAFSLGRGGANSQIPCGWQMQNLFLGVYIHQEAEGMVLQLVAPTQGLW